MAAFKHARSRLANRIDNFYEYCTNGSDERKAALSATFTAATSGVAALGIELAHLKRISNFEGVLLFGPFGMGSMLFTPFVTVKYGFRVARAKVAKILQARHEIKTPQKEVVGTIATDST